MTARTRKTRQSAKPRAGKYIAIMFLITAVTMMVALVVAGVNLMLSWLEDLPDYSDADSYLVAEPSTILDADGNVITQFYAENRTPITIDECSPYILKATVDIEDERFYEHNGIDIKGIARAVVVQLLGGSEGASTITQQLVRNTVLKDEQFEKTLSRKVREAYISLELEKVFTKDEILMMYLNSIYYGAGCYGIEAASQTYFGKSCKDLTLAEAATLAGLPQSPSSYQPTTNPNAAIERRNAVLARMLANGDITQEEYDTTVAEPLVLNVTYRTQSGTSNYPYFVDYVRSQLLQQFSSDIIYKGGLTIVTTLDPTMQQQAEDAVNSVIGLAWDDLEAALVAIDPNTGYVKAMVGGWDYNTDQFNLATMARRQPGSSFKVFTLVAAIQAGVNPTVLINANSPITIGDWTVANNDYESYGIISLAQATAWSSNTAYAQVIDEIGAQTVADTAHAMGITSDLDVYNNLTLGTSGCSVLEMASAYGTLATGGVYYEPTVITQVLDRNGNVLYQHEPVGEQVISTEVAYAATEVLEGVLTGSGTGIEAVPDVDQPVAGKTGTTEQVRDLWFCGYTPQLSCAVWVGYRVEATIYYLGSRGTTHTLPNPIFSRFMTAALAGLPREEFTWAPSPVYQDNSVWSFSMGTYTEEAEETTEETTEDGTGTTTTTSPETTEYVDPGYTTTDAAA